ncbi:MAG: hypothetical protein GY871_17535 [Actinomycetales bacterium]|nr:hypothetical protein [Actinomycetales bacterium]
MSNNNNAEKKQPYSGWLVSNSLSERAIAVVLHHMFGVLLLGVIAGILGGMVTVGLIAAGSAVGPPVEVSP